jgi:hypothetical protein
LSPMTHSTFSALVGTRPMSKSTFEFLCDTLEIEISSHPYHSELLSLINEQIEDDRSF